MKLKYVLGSLLLCTSALYSEYSANCSQEIVVQIQISCPKSQEYSAFVATIPQNPQDEVEHYEEWRDSFVTQMQQLIELVQSGKVGNTSLSVSAYDADSQSPSDPVEQH